MPNQILPISGLADAGLIEDMPSVALPPNAFSDCLNVRFRDGTLKKFPKQQQLIGSLSDVVYVAEWPSTLGKRYVVLREVSNNIVFTVYDDEWNTVANQGGTLTGVTGGTWQHTLFNGGYHIIFNNGNSKPVFLQDDLLGVVELPGWDSYTVETTKVQFEHDGDSSFEQTVNATLEANTTIKVTRLPRNTSDPIYTDKVTVNSTVDGVDPDGTMVNVGTISNVTATGFTFTPETTSGGDLYRIAIVSDPVVDVTCGVIRSYGNLLVAGNLRESNGRVLTGTIRTSDVAAPGELPQEWNPFRNGANTADEFILASTGIIKDMAELQGVLYVYTDSSIHSIQHTGSTSIPFQVGIVTGNYGANNIASVVEIDGKHIVYGSNDCYVFAGHPGSISSICDGRVRSFFRDETDIKVMRFNKYDELWFMSDTVIYVWNYRNNTWTKRSLPTGTVAASAGSNDLLFATSTSIEGVDHPSTYESAYVERRRLSLQDEYGTETLVAIGFLADGGNAVTCNVVATDVPGDLTASVTDSANDKDLVLANEYKQDIRVTGRFLNFRLTHDATSNFNLTGLQLEIGQGGRR